MAFSCYNPLLLYTSKGWLYQTSVFLAQLNNAPTYPLPGCYESAGPHSATHTSLKTKLANVISSATDTEEVHTMLDALLPPDTYFRFNPYLSEDVPLDKSRPEQLNFLKGEGERYLDSNQAKLAKAAGALAQEKGVIQRLAEWARLKANMYDGPPFLSKL